MIVEVNDSVFSYTALRIRSLKQFIQQNKNSGAAAKTSRFRSALRIFHPLLQGIYMRLIFALYQACTYKCETVRILRFFSMMDSDYAFKNKMMDIF